MKSKQFSHKLLPAMMSFLLALNSLSPAYAAQTDALITDSDPAVFSVSENTGYAQASPSVSFITDTENEEALTPETVADQISFTFFDSDGMTPLYGPLIKDLTVLTNPADGRYPFDEVVNGVSTATENGHYILPWVHNGREIKNWTRVNTGRINEFYSLAGKTYKESETFIANYKGGNYDYSIEYITDGGFLETDSDMPIPYSFHIESEPITLPTSYKKGYEFTGWTVVNPSSKEAYQTTITTIPTGTAIEYSYGDYQNGIFKGYQLQANYTKIEVQTPTIGSVSNKKSGVATVSVKANPLETGTVSYELTYSVDKKFPKKSTHMVDLGSKTSYQITNMPKGKTYFFKVRAYKADSKGEKIFSDYSDVAQLKIKKGVTESKKITASSAKLKAANVKIDNEKNLLVNATVNKRLKSYDDFYYLVAVDPTNGKIIRSIAESDKTKKVVFKTPVRDDKGTNLINGKYALAVKTSKKQFKQISAAFFIQNPEAAADYTAPYPVTKSKKGIQGSLNTELGVQQGFTNFHINSIFADGNYGTKYVYNGKTYYFNAPYSIMNYAKSCNELGITCSVQLMMNWPGTGKYKPLLFGTSSNKAPFNLYAINSSTPQSREMVEAAFSFLAEYCAQEDCHVDNWILGNEVNIYDQWYYAGSTGYDAFMKNYASTFRILYHSIKGRNKNARIFICTDHTWKNRCGDWGAKPFMDSFNSQIKAMNPKIQWNLAYHAYPSILYMPATWRDSYAPNSDNADFVSPKNLNVLTSYVKNTYGKNTRIIISECGFTNAEGEAVQAAALAYSFYKAQFDDMIDAFIIRTEIDAPGEKLTRLDGAVIDAAFGLRSASGNKRASYDVFKYMDTPQYAKYTDNCLKTIGANSWDSIIPGFKDSTLKALPNR